MINWLFKQWYKYHLEKSIKNKGMIAPLLISNDGVVLDGNRRLAIAKRLNLDFIPVVRLSANVEYVSPDEIYSAYEF